MMNTLIDKYWAHLCVTLAALISLYFKFSLISTGAPYTTIDDNTLFNAGFFVWFGEAPPQRMYLESWIVGLCEIATYLFHLVSTGHVHQLSINFIADAFRDFQQAPYDYVRNYRCVMIFFDLLTAYVIYCTARIFFTDSKTSCYALIPASLFLLSYNTLWCDLVARPDTITAFLAALGIYAYYRSDFGTIGKYFYLSAVALGCATGMKLHAAFFVLVLTIDLIRVHGFRNSLQFIMPFGALSILLFLVTAGSPLFAPLLYVKLRVLNAVDDASPWIHWGDQFLVALKATGWITIPAILAITYYFRRLPADRLTPALKSLLLIGWLFIVFFCCVRVLRGYWMLPALPIFYILASQIFYFFKNKQLAAVALIGILGLFSYQMFQQTLLFKNARYTELQNWVKENVKPDESIYILGYETLFLPLNTNALSVRKAVELQMLSDAERDGESFTMRHVRLWEERAGLLSIDMLNTTSDGVEYYGLNSTPTSFLEHYKAINQIKYLLVMKGYNTPEAKEFLVTYGNNFSYLTTKNAPGGNDGVGGLAYDIYVNRSN